MIVTKLKLNLFRLRKAFKSSQLSVATWSPLGTAFNALPAKKFNMKILTEDKGLFGAKSLSSPVGFYSLKEEACDKADRLVAEAISPNRSRRMVDIFDDLSNTLCCVADLAEFIRVAHPKAAYRNAAEDASYHISNVVEQLNTNKELYDKLREIIEKGDKVPTTEVDNHVANLFLFDFEQSGIHLPEKERQSVVSLTESAMTLGQYFINGCNKERAVDKKLLPGHLQSYFSSDKDNVVVSNMQSDCPIEAVREIAYKVYLYPDEHQEYLLQEMLKVRRELAQICGFSSFAQRATRGTTAETPEFVENFLETLNSQMRPLLNDDLDLLMETKKQTDPTATTLKHWDISYLSGIVKSNFLQIGNLDVTDFFCLGACMEGLNNLTQSLYGISLRYEDISHDEIWAPDVYKLAVEHETEGLLGYIYCDFYRRPGKPNQDCHFTIRGGRMKEDGTYQNPIVVLMLNLNAPRWSGPCLLSPSQLDNLVHEMGHALHSMMARTVHQHVTGTRCATDFAEVPSILMEFFLADPRVLRTFAKHFQTKETMPDEAINRLCQSKHLLAATETQTQILYSVLDQKLHGPNPIETSTTEIFNQLQEKYHVLEPVPNTGWQLRFSHLVGYGARYYSYLLSRSAASCIWQTYFAADPFSREAGEAYRSNCLSHGGGKPPRLLLSQFLGQEIKPELMAQSLVTDISQRQNSLTNI